METGPQFIVPSDRLEKPRIEPETPELIMKRNYTICVVKTKALISFAVTKKLVCAFVIAYADFWFSDAAAQLQGISLQWNKCPCNLRKYMDNPRMNYSISAPDP